MKKRVYLILTDENLFHPYYIIGVLSKLKADYYEVVGVTIMKDKYKKGFTNFIRMQYLLWGLTGFIAIGILNYYQLFLDKVRYKRRITLRGILDNYSIPYVESHNVNSADHLEYLKKKKIDLILSSCGQIFKKDLLNIPKIACINRHTALLPKYGGVLPVFWAMYYNEKKFGVSIHYMKLKIDEGDILYQKSIPLEKENSLFKNYILGFTESIDVTMKALDNLEKNIIAVRFSLDKKSYFTFPNKIEFHSFKKNHKTFEISDLLYFRKNLSNQLLLSGYNDKFSR